jgi:hypothetical protein
MEKSIWDKFVRFIRESFSEKFKYCFPGCLMGFWGAKSLLFAGLSSEMVTIGAYILKYIGTVLMAFSSGLATSYAAYLIEKHKNKKDESQTRTRKRSRPDKTA